MKGRERKIPVQIYNENDDSAEKHESKHFEYIENKEEQAIDEILQKKQTERPDQREEPARVENENVMQGLIEHQEESPREKITKKDRRNLILWLGVSVFVLITIIVWGMSLRFNINQVNDELQKDEDLNTVNSVSEKFISSFEFIKNNINEFEDLKESLETENTKDQTIDQLKNKIEEENIEKKQLPEINN